MPGRKSLSGGNKHSPLVQFRVSEETREALEKLAGTRGVSLSRLSREIIENAVREAG